MENIRGKQFEAVQKEGLRLFKKKNKDYGDSFATHGPIGVIIRMGDKINRLSSVTKNEIKFVDNESLRDTLIDLHNYSAMAIMLMDEKPEIHPRIKELQKQTNTGSKYPNQANTTDKWSNGKFNDSDYHKFLNGPPYF